MSYGDYRSERRGYEDKRYADDGGSRLVREGPGKDGGKGGGAGLGEGASLEEAGLHEVGLHGVGLQKAGLGGAGPGETGLGEAGYGWRSRRRGDEPEGGGRRGEIRRRSRPQAKNRVAAVPVS